jgi:eukaryotic-like serine/threonine-protein kinase
MAPSSPSSPLIIGRYALYDKVASGGMATVYIGRLAGPVGFSKTVAIKRLHPQFASDAEFVSMFLDEARLAARIQHPNVVSTLDVVATMGELFLVMEYVRGESVSALMRHLGTTSERMPPRIAAAIASGALQGLHAAHTATDEAGHALGIVHRDVSPQNILVGIDGTPRVLDFGVAKAENKLHSTRGGEIKGKLLYMPPEQLEGDAVDCTADVYAMGLLLFEMLTGQRMFQKSEDMAAVAKIMRNEVTLPGARDPALAAWDSIVRRATAKAPGGRYPTARAMALEVERVTGVASPVEVSDFVERLAGETIKGRSRRIAEIESISGSAARAFGQAALVEELARSSAPTMPLDIDVGDTRAEPRSEKSVGSKVSHSLSVSKATAPQKKRWWPVAAAAGVVSVGLAVALAFAGRSAPAGDASASVAAAPSTAASTTPPAAAPGPTADVAAEPVAAPPPTGGQATPEARDAAALPPSPPPARPRAQPPRPASKPNCDRPTTVDSAGHVHFRAECL